MVAQFRHDDPEVLAVQDALPGHGINYNRDAIVEVLNCFFRLHGLFPERNPWGEPGPFGGWVTAKELGLPE